jgi:tRNA G18 (ribose-2'-O)-methylase SpoU
MAFTIPMKSLHSFTAKQAVESIYRMANQAVDEQEKNSQVEGRQKTEAIEVLWASLTELKKHENQEVVRFAKEALFIDPSTAPKLGLLIMFCERFKGKDLREDDFLISTMDTQMIKSEPKTGERTREVHFVLDNLRSAFNVGSLFRTAESFGLTHIHLCGYTATPENSKAAKSALGTQDWIKWTYWQSTLECLEQLKGEGVSLYALETAEGAIELSEVLPKNPAALIFGNERYGLAAPVLKRADYIIKVALAGKKNSLNVGVCAGIAAHHFSSNKE